jgi:arylsulfatase A-like enzyme
VEHAGTLSLIAGKWKYVAPGKGPRIQQTTNTELGNDPAPQLYDLDHDPGERVNLAARYPVRVREMAAQLEKIRAAPRTRP